MIQPADFDIGHDGLAVYVRVVHRPIGNARHITEVTDVGRAREALLKELKGLVFEAEDFRIDLVCGRGIGWTRVTHVPSGVCSSAENVGDGRAIIDDLTDRVLDELHASGRLAVMT